MSIENITLHVKVSQGNQYFIVFDHWDPIIDINKKNQGKIER